MQRQRSILSFLHKPPPGSQRPGGASSQSDLLRRPPSKQEPVEIHSVAQNAGVKDSFSDVRGTDTPPEKIRRPFFPSGASDSDSESPARSFASIVHKFARDDGLNTASKGNQGDCGSVDLQAKSDKSFEHHVDKKLEVPSQNFLNNLASMHKEDGSGAVFPNFDLGLGILGPETPAIRKLVPRFKRIQEDHYDSHEKQGSLPFVSNKRPKILQDSVVGRKTSGELPDSASSKFEWLNPSSIRDKDGRRPDDPLYDKRTLYIPSDALKKMSASQKQYWSVKCQYMDVVLFFKVGKFYELYELDAEIGQKELDWKMTVSGVGKCRQVGISEAGIDDAVQKLIARGYKVGRMEQLETADQAKARGASSVIQRKLVHVSTPSTTNNGIMGPDAVHLLALKEGNHVMANGCRMYGFAFLDYAALNVWVGSLCDDASCAALGALLLQVSPREILFENKGLSKETHKALIKYASAGSTSMQLTPANPGSDFLDVSEVKKLIQAKGYFKGSSNVWTSAFDCTMHRDLALCALGGLISHLCRLMLDDSLRNGELLPYHVYKSCLRMDGQTLVNLEIFSNNSDGGLSGTLYKHLDHCITSSGKRLLRRWICHPMKDIDEINDRLNVVEGLIKNSGVNSVIAEYLRRLPDLERLLGRVKASVGSSAALLLPLVGIRLLKQRIKAFGCLIKGLRIGIDLLTVLQKEDHGIVSLSKLVNLPTLSALGALLKQFETTMDEDFPQYQDHDVKESDAETLSILVELFVGKAAEWSHVNYALSCIDVLQSFAAAAISSYGSMSRPVILPSSNHQRKSSGPILHIKGLWHPYAVGENGNSLVPNDMYLGEAISSSHPCTLLLTGPNMGGKSTLLRATCLAVILAQLGSYVPCNMCVLSPADIIFTRLGATDRIMSGESTFLVECAETSSVLQNATSDSLVLLDELGRGTSTFDGYAIAYAVFRHLVEKVGCRLLFATHYHPLTKEFASHPHVRLQHMACAFKPKEGNLLHGDELIFLYRLASGACPESYGLQVALMAGIPKTIVDAASKASQRMKLMISANFKSSEGRSEFSTLHEEWLKSLLVVSRITEEGCLDEDASDTLLCLWHEVKNFYRPSN